MAWAGLAAVPGRRRAVSGRERLEARRRPAVWIDRGATADGDGGRRAEGQNVDHDQRGSWPTGSLRSGQSPVEPDSRPGLAVLQMIIHAAPGSVGCAGTQVPVYPAPHASLTIAGPPQLPGGRLPACRRPDGSPTGFVPHPRPRPTGPAARTHHPKPASHLRGRPVSGATLLVATALHIRDWHGGRPWRRAGQDLGSARGLSQELRQ